MLLVAEKVVTTASLSRTITTPLFPTVFRHPVRGMASNVEHSSNISYLKEKYQPMIPASLRDRHTKAPDKPPPGPIRPSHRRTPTPNPPQQSPTLSYVSGNTNPSPSTPTQSLGKRQMEGNHESANAGRRAPSCPPSFLLRLQITNQVIDSRWSQASLHESR